LQPVICQSVLCIFQDLLFLPFSNLEGWIKTHVSVTFVVILIRSHVNGLTWSTNFAANIAISYTLVKQQELWQRDSLSIPPPSGNLIKKVLWLNTSKLFMQARNRPSSNLHFQSLKNADLPHKQLYSKVCSYETWSLQ